ncbi:MAG: hypothetical protein J2P34_07275, partial [Actinobacteria bacterium]|nr:hypothetical protein [Actinomycetota bacterium]
IMTRPVGASFADWLGVPPALGGIGLGRGLVSLALTVIIAAALGFLAVTARGNSGHPAGRPAGGRHRAGRRPVTAPPSW